MHSSPVANCSIVVTITLIGVVDDPPDIVTRISTDPDDSAIVYSPTSKFITNTTQSNDNISYFI